LELLINRYMLTKSKSFADESILRLNCGFWRGILDTPLAQLRGQQPFQL